MSFYPAVISIWMHISLVCFISSVSATCYKGGEEFAVGTFDDPSEDCSVCECKVDKTYTCEPKSCPAQECGEDLLSDSPDGCCKICSRKCTGVLCPEIDCTEDRYHYKNGSCCPECGCKTELILGPYEYIGDLCDRCRRKKNGQMVCKRPECPAVKLECVDPEYDECCNYICPNGKTCQQGKHVIKYGEFKIVGKNVCTCVGDWYPRAFCAKRMKVLSTEKLEKTRCVADATRYTAWKQVEALYAPVTTIPSPVNPPPLL